MYPRSWPPTINRLEAFSDYSTAVKFGLQGDYTKLPAPEYLYVPAKCTLEVGLQQLTGWKHFLIIQQQSNLGYKGTILSSLLQSTCTSLPNVPSKLASDN